MAEEGGRRWMFKAKTPRFSTIVPDNSVRDEKLCLPKLFTAEYGGLLPDKVLLKLPSGALWQVGLFKSGEKIWFQEGWREFAESCGLASGQLLVFEYGGSHGHFLVLIFDHTATEINYLTDDEANGRVESECRVDISDGTSDDDLSSPKAREKSPLRPPQPKKLKRRRNEGGRVGRTSEAIFCHSSTSRVQDNPNQKRIRTSSQKEKPLTAAQRDSALARAMFAFQSKNPFFMIVVQPSYLGPGRKLYLPINFVKTNLEEKCGDIELQLPDGRAWMVKYVVVNAYPNRKRAMFGSGRWGQFAQESSLRVGDVCVFELVEGGANPRLKVVIFQAPQDGNCCSSPRRSENGLNDAELKKNPQSPGNMRKPPKHEDDGNGQQESSTQTDHVEAANAFTSNQPFFRVAVANSHLSRGQMTIPQAFSNHVEEVCDEAELPFAGKCWFVRIGSVLRTGGRQEMYLGSGWSAFAAWNCLEVGDVCVYELVKGNDDDTCKRLMVLDVHIFGARLE